MDFTSYAMAGPHAYGLHVPTFREGRQQAVYPGYYEAVVRAIVAVLQQEGAEIALHAQDCAVYFAMTWTLAERLGLPGQRGAALDSVG